MRLLRGCALGDAILLLGAAVFVARKLGRIRILVSPNYYKSIQDLLVTHPEVIPFTYENEAMLPDDGTFKLFDYDGPSLISRMDGSPTDWYKDLGVPFTERWDNCPIPEATGRIYPSNIAPVFVHDDRLRGFNIAIEGYRPPVTASIVDHVPAIKGAKEIHCMDSAFFNLIDSMDPLDADLFYYPNVKGHYPDTERRQCWRVVI